jgi:hypothetical protein
MSRTLALAAAVLALARAASAQSPAPSTPPPATATAPAATAPTAAATATAPAAPAAETVPPAQPVPAVAPVPTPPPQVVAPAPASQPQVVAPAPASQPAARRIYGWASAGTSYAYGEYYASANVGLGYMLGHGITPNVEASYMFANSPTVWALRPGVTWYMPVKVIQPYVGVYYTHWFVSGARPDEDGIGARAGISLGRFLSLGFTYDRALDCSGDCDSWSPQISAGFSM